MRLHAHCSPTHRLCGQLVPDHLHGVLTLHHQSLVQLHLLLGPLRPPQLPVALPHPHQAHPQLLATHGQLPAQPAHLREGGGGLLLRLGQDQLEGIRIEGSALFLRNVPT